MSTTIVMTSVAAASAASASSAASRARFESCKMTIIQFDNKTATVEQMREYAACVENNFPMPADAGTTLMIKIFIVLSLIGLIGGIVKAYRDYLEGWRGLETFILFAIFGAVAIPAAAFVLLVIVKAIRFLFT